MQVGSGAKAMMYYDTRSDELSEEDSEGRTELEDFFAPQLPRQDPLH